MEGPKTQEAILQEQLQAKTQLAADYAKAGGRAAGEIVLSTWRGARTVSEKLVLAGGVAGLISFFLPWFSFTAFVFSVSGSGFALARQGKHTLWLFPLAMIAALFLSWLHQHSNWKKRILAARWLVLSGAAWTWDLGDTLISGGATVSIGGYLATAASLLVLAGGFLQISEQIRASMAEGGSDL